MFVRFLWCLMLVLASGCTVKAVGDPNRPITIEAHVTIDIKGLKDTASNIEDYVSGKEDKVPVAKNSQSK
ncbi:MAG: hypothetical protein HQL15_01690 [Candidatus Omnitrophica bacterium]|nr:hypothetical protein [Candidatus Omnitrophota bacterium]